MIKYTDQCVHRLKKNKGHNLTPSQMTIKGAYGIFMVRILACTGLFHDTEIYYRMQH